MMRVPAVDLLWFPTGGNGKRVIEPTACHGGAHQEIQGRYDKEVGERVHRVEVRELDVQDRESQQGSGKQCDALAVQPPPDEEQHQDRADIEQAGRRAAHQRQVVIVVKVQPDGDPLDEIYRQCAVYVQTHIGERVRAKGGCIWIEIVLGILRPLEIVGDGAQEALVGMEMPAAIPIEAVEAKPGGQQDHDHQADIDGTRVSEQACPVLQARPQGKDVGLFPGGIFKGGRSHLVHVPCRPILSLKTREGHAYGWAGVMASGGIGSQSPFGRRQNSRSAEPPPCWK